jgi:hypothetical protein
MKYVILIDAGFLKRKHGSQAEPLDINGVRAFLDALRAHEVLAGVSLHRVYWYDGCAAARYQRQSNCCCGERASAEGRSGQCHQILVARGNLSSTMGKYPSDNRRRANEPDLNRFPDISSRSSTYNRRGTMMSLTLASYHLALDWETHGHVASRQ